MGEQDPTDVTGHREGSLEAPTRHPIPWKTPDFYDEGALFQELTRVFDICHGCRRCVSLCNAFPTLFDLVDNSETLEVDGVAHRDFWSVVEHCYLCDLCFMTKCPYVPPHPWNVDFPHLMLRAKAVGYAQGRSKKRDRLLAATDALGHIAGIPVVAGLVNAATRNRTVRKAMAPTLGIHPEAPLPEYQGRTLRRRLRRRRPSGSTALAAAQTRGRVVLYASCYGNYNEPQIAEDLIAVFEHNGIPVELVEEEVCCGMPKLEIGDLPAVETLKERNIPRLARWVGEGWDLVAPVPSCVLMFKQELPLLFPEDPEVKAVSEAFNDPFEYLHLRHKAGQLRLEFKNTLGTVAYHAPCHQRVQNIGPRTREVLSLVPGTTVEAIERCSGHDGTYAMKREFHEVSMRIGAPVAQRVAGSGAEHYASDCPMAGRQIQHGMKSVQKPENPLSLLRYAYGI